MEKLTKAEERVMQAIWKRKRAMVRDILPDLGPPEPKYTTISTVVRILVDKGFVGFKAYGRTHEYFPLISKAEYKTFTFKKMLADYFEGSYQNVVSFIVQEEELSEEELHDIRRLIDNTDHDA
ncbi:MAG: BlaI/MecI/CopY family transcriptional regulator [Bacteroidota bacterium]